MRKRLLIIGAGGHGTVCADIAEKSMVWQETAFLDDNTNLKNCMGYPVIGKVADASDLKENTEFFVAVGNNSVRKKLLEMLIAEGCFVVTLVHPDAVIGARCVIEDGTVIMAGTVINTGSKIGKGCIINTGSSIDHDCVIRDYVHISPGVHLAGEVVIGKESWLGIGSIVSNQVSIGGGVCTGAGTVVIKDIDVKGTYVGVPARFLG